MTKNDAPDKEQDQKHDKGYKDVLSRTEVFAHFVKKYIAKPWAADISPEDIERVDTSYITDEYKYMDADLIYKVKSKTGGADIYFYVLIELQSRVDYTMPFRLLTYIVALLTDVFKNTDKKTRKRKDFRLPAVVPIVLYNGKANWTAVRNYREYTENFEIFGDSIIDFNYLLFDLERTDEETILSSQKVLDIIFAIDKKRFGEFDLGVINKLAERNRMSDFTSDDVITLLRWLINVGGRNIAPSEIKKVLKQTLIKQGGRDIMRKKNGIEIFFDTLEEKGEMKRATAVAKKMIADGKDVNEIVRYSGLDQNDVLKLMGVM